MAVTPEDIIRELSLNAPFGAGKTLRYLWELMDDVRSEYGAQMEGVVPDDVAQGIHDRVETYLAREYQY